MITKRTHFIPCFWAAYWNKEYYERVLNSGIKKDPRGQEIWSLNIKAGKILHTKIERVHCEKNLGLSEITEGDIKTYISENHPEKLEEHLSQIRSSEYPLLWCYENIFTGIEEQPPYKILEKVINRGSIDSFEEKVWLSSFMILQRIRGHAFIHSMAETAKLLAKPKFEYMLYMKHILADQELMFKATHPIANAKWSFHISDRHRLPLCDSPILLENDSIMVALSPRLLLEVDLKKSAIHEELTLTKRLNKNIVNEHKKRTINNTHKEIVFNKLSVLESYLEDPLFKSRAKTIGRQWVKT